MKAIITGASSGIGKAFAKRFSREGYEVILVARNKERLLEVKKDLEKRYKRDVMAVAVDLTKEDARKKLMTALPDNLDVLVNNAGFGDYGKFIDASWEKQQAMIQLNMEALTHITKLFLEKGGKQVLNVASTAAFMPGPLMSVYFATKAYVLSFSEALAEEGIAVTTLCPGPTQSEFQERANLTIDTKNLPTAKDVADYGFESMKKGKRIAVHGLKNKLFVLLPRILPRKTVTALVKKYF